MFNLTSFGSLEVNSPFRKYIFVPSLKKSLLILFLCAISAIGFAQDGVIDFNGRVVSGSTPLYNVSIVDLNNQRGSVSDVYGNFSVQVKAGDTIRFSSIGYKTVSYAISDTITAESFRVLVNMIGDTVLLQEAIIMPWPPNTTMLKKAMLSKTKEKETISPYAGFREIEGDPVEPEPKLFANPISFIFSKLSKKARQEKKMEKYREILKEKEIYTPEPIY